MKFIDLNHQYHLLKTRIDARIQGVLSHGQYIMGPEMIELERQLAERVGVTHCITVSSGTMALQLALMALGIGPGDEVITTPFSFFATAETILLLGAIPVFVDIDSKTYNLNPVLLERAITKRTKAILPVSLYGQCADFTAINEIANRYGLPVIEDGAQSLGASHYGQQSCSMTTIGCTSFFPSKPLGCYGDGGACFTNDDDLAHAMRLIRNHGQETRYYHTVIGTNARFDTIQSAILLAKLEVFDQEIENRQRIASWYESFLDGALITPYVASGNLSVYAQYTVQVDHRDVVRNALENRGIPTAIHYPKPIYQQPAIEKYMTTSPHCPETDLVAARVLSLPFHPYLDKTVVEQVCEELLFLVQKMSQHVDNLSAIS